MERTVVQNVGSILGLLRIFSLLLWYYFVSRNLIFGGPIISLLTSLLLFCSQFSHLFSFCSTANFPICFPHHIYFQMNWKFRTTYNLHLVNHFARVLNKVTKGQKKKHCLTLKNSGRTGRCVKPWKSLCMSNCVFFCKTYKPSDGGSWLLWPGGIIFNREINDEESCVTPSLGWLNIRKST